MNSMKINKFFTVVIASVLVASASVAVAPAAHAATTCTSAAGVETCTGTLKNGAQFMTKMPSNFTGTMFFWNHGIRSSYTLAGTPYTAPGGFEELTPYSNNAKSDVTEYMLAMGYGLASYDGIDKGLRGWNGSVRVGMLKELIDTAKAKYPKTTKNVVYGSSIAGGSILSQFAEKYPKSVDAVGVMSGLTPNPAQAVKSLCDAMFILAVFADPTIKGCAAFTGAGAAGLGAATAELGKVAALLRGWSLDYGQNSLAYPAALAGGPIPQRSMLLLTGLLIGIPTKSDHMDGITTGTLVPEQSINATVGVLENLGESIATGVLAGHSIAQAIGPNFYDNTKTNYSNLLTESDSGRFNLGLSGDGGVTAMLGVLAAAPRVTGDASTVTKFENLDKASNNSTKPFIFLANEADRLVFPGNTARTVDKMNAAYKKRLAAAKGLATKPINNVVSLYAFTPARYTKYTAGGAPDLTAPKAVSGIGHQDYTIAQMQAWVTMLALAAESGSVTPADVALFSTGVDFLNTDPGWRPSELKYKK